MTFFDEAPDGFYRQFVLKQKCLFLDMCFQPSAIGQTDNVIRPGHACGGIGAPGQSRCVRRASWAWPGAFENTLVAFGKGTLGGPVRSEVLGVG